MWTKNTTCGSRTVAKNNHSQETKNLACMELPFWSTPKMVQLKMGTKCSIFLISVALVKPIWFAAHNSQNITFSSKQLTNYIISPSIQFLFKFDLGISLPPEVKTWTTLQIFHTILLLLKYCTLSFQLIIFLSKHVVYNYIIVESFLETTDEPEEWLPSPLLLYWFLASDCIENWSYFLCSTNVFVSQFHSTTTTYVLHTTVYGCVSNYN